ncbi:MAG: kelch repeat-containing protein [Planctomycetota bacterium]
MRTRPVLALSAALALGATADAMTAEITRSGGVIGQSVTYELQGDPGELWGLAFGVTEGPTPLVLFDPNDSRLLDVGLEFLNLWQLGPFDGAGQATVVLPIPAQPSLQGLPFFAQMVTLPGTTTLVDEISAQTGFVLGEADTTMFTLAELDEALFNHAMTSLDDGRVLLSGGVRPDALGDGIARDELRIFDNQTGRFTLSTATMSADRTQHTETKLADGRVLLLGGSDEDILVTATGDIYDPVTDIASPIADMSVPRVGHTATLLPDGRVFVAGGTSGVDFENLLGSFGLFHQTTEIYDPSTDTWSAGPNLPEPRALHAASLLGNGQVLITGGIEIISILFIETPFFSSDVRRFDPTSGSLLGTPSFNEERAGHAQVTLPNGDALLVGGINGSFLTLTTDTLTSTRLYDTSANTWSNVGDLNIARVLPRLLATGDSVVCVGGIVSFDLSTLQGPPVVEIEESTNMGSTWSTTASLSFPRPFAPAALFDGGDRVLISGAGDNGSGGVTPDTTAEIYIP